MARFENPYVGFAEMSSETAVADAVAQILMDAWWRGWDRQRPDRPCPCAQLAMSQKEASTSLRRFGKNERWTCFLVPI